MIRWWVSLWNRAEVPWALALVRIGVGLCLFADSVRIFQLGLLDIWASSEVGGLSVVPEGKAPLLWSLLPADAGTAALLWGVMAVSSLCFALGLGTRVSNLVFLLAYAQTNLIASSADRGIDVLMRNVLCILLFSAAGKVLSVDAWRRTGSWLGDGSTAPNWPRYLLVCQLVFMYFLAGVTKASHAWTPAGGYTALYYILLQPNTARFDHHWWAEPLLPFLQLSAGLTHLWEWLAPTVLLAYFFRDTRDRPGRLRAFFNRVHWLEGWVLFGVSFHVLLVLWLLLGIFPFAMLALYPAFFSADEWARWLALGRKDRPEAIEEDVAG